MFSITTFIFLMDCDFCHCDFWSWREHMLLIELPTPTRSKHCSGFIKNSSPQTSLKWIRGSHNSCKKSAIQSRFFVCHNRPGSRPYLRNSLIINKMVRSWIVQTFSNRNKFFCGFLLYYTLLRKKIIDECRIKNGGQT